MRPEIKCMEEVGRSRKMSSEIVPSLPQNPIKTLTQRQQQQQAIMSESINWSAITHLTRCKWFAFLFAHIHTHEYPTIANGDGKKIYVQKDLGPLSVNEIWRGKSD